MRLAAPLWYFLFLFGVLDSLYADWWQNVIAPALIQPFNHLA
jgi:hypothetical protein